MYSSCTIILWSAAHVHSIVYNQGGVIHARQASDIWVDRVGTMWSRNCKMVGACISDSSSTSCRRTAKMSFLSVLNRSMYQKMKCR